MTRPKAAVVGSGVAGLTAAYLLQRRYDVTLFEADGRLGGHAHTHELPTVDGRAVDVDTGFIVHNRRTYPNLLRLFAELGVATQESDMSMSVRCAGCGLEYAGARGLGGLFPQASNLARPAYLRMLAEVRRFHRHARAAGRREGGPDDRTDDASRSARSWPPAATRATSSSTSCCRSSHRCGRRARRCRSPTRPATCSRSCTTTGCSPSRDRRAGARSSAGRGATSRRP